MIVSGSPGAVDLYWIPLGAGAHVVRISGKAFETVAALATSTTRPWWSRFRRWREGRIPDIDAAIASPVRLSDDLTRHTISWADAR